MDLIKTVSKMPRPYNNNFNLSFNDNNTTNLFNKKLRALKKYCPKAYKYLLFESQKTEKKDGTYVEKLPTSKEFKFVYGQITVQYEVKNGAIYYQELEPSQFFIDGYNFDLEVYKGIYYRNNRDKFKIDLFISMKKERNYAI